MRSIKTLFIVFVIIAIGLGIILLRQRSVSISGLAFFSTSPTPLLVPTIAFIPDSSSDHMDSPDGTKTLTIDGFYREDATEYSISITSAETQSRERIFTTVDFSDKVTIPYNTWSPDNKFFFLKETTPTKTNYYVFRVSSEAFSDGSQYLDVQKFFTQKYDNFEITDVTGWAGINLLLVNAKAIGGEEKASFWFEVNRQRFTRLSTYFR